MAEIACHIRRKKTLAQWMTEREQLRLEGCPNSCQKADVGRDLSVKAGCNVSMLLIPHLL